MWAIQTLRCYVQGTHFTLYSDQASLQRLLKTFESNGRLKRWHMRLSELDFEVWDKKGLCNTHADTLPHRRSLEKTTVPVDADSPTYFRHSNATPNNLDGKFDHNAELALAIDTSPSFVSITLGEVHLS